MEQMIYRAQLGTSLDADAEPTTGAGIVDMELFWHNGTAMLYTLSLVDEGIQVYTLDGDATAATVEFQEIPGWMSPFALTGLGSLSLNGTSYVYIDGTGTDDLIGFDLRTGGDLDRTRVFDAPLPFTGRLRQALEVEMDGAQFLITAQQGVTGLRDYRIESNRNLTEMGGPISGSRWIEGEDIQDLASAVVDGTTYIMAAVDGLNAVVVYRLRGDGRVEEVSSFGADNGFGITTPTALKTVQMYDQTYVLVTASGSSTLSVMRLDGDGILTPTDHLLDSRDTRFDGALALETVTVDNRTYVLAAGGDDGVSLFVLLPDGRLHHLDTVEDSEGISLNNVSAISAVRIGDELQVFISSQSEAKVSQFGVSLAEAGVTWGGRDYGQTINGTSKNDIINGAGGNDAVNGGDGDDIVMDGSGTDTLSGGAGRDVFSMAADDELDRIADFDVMQDRLDLTRWRQLRDVGDLDIQTAPTGATITYGDEVLEITSSDGTGLAAATLRATINLSSVQRLAFGSVAIGSNIEGTSSSEILEGSGDDDRIDGKGGNDWIVGHAGRDSLFAGDGDDLMNGGDGSDRMDGGAGADTIHAETGNDSVWGGTGRDLIFLDDGNDLFEDDDQSDIEGTDTVYGGRGNDRIVGGGGNDLLYGEDGIDTIFGGSQYDTIIAGDGDDWVDAGYGKDIVHLGRGNDVFEDSDQTGSKAGDTIYAGDGDDTVIGRGGDDVIKGDVGNDLLYGGEGDDRIEGGGYFDTIYAGDGNDWVSGGGGRDVVYLGNGNDYFDDDTQTGSKARDTIYAGDGDDTIMSRGGDDFIEGEGGNDLIYGGSGYNRIDGGSYYDTIYAGAGDDEVIGGAGKDLVYLDDGNDLFIDDPQSNRHGNDEVYGGAGNDSIMGDGGNDLFRGDAGDDLVIGGAGNDTLSGDAGNDTLTGGTGNDRFEHGVGDGVDRITDFTPAEDMLSLSRDLWGGEALSASEVLSRFATVSGGRVEFTFDDGSSIELDGVETVAEMENSLSFL